MALILANVNSYLWNTRWTFRHHPNYDTRQSSLFVARAALNVAVGSILLWLDAHWLLSYASLSPWFGGNLAKMVSMVVASTASFFLLQFIVFHRQPNNQELT